MEGVRKDIQDVKRDIAKIETRESKVDEMREWKSKMDEAATPTQVKEIVRQVDDLKTFKTKAITVFAVVQFLMAGLTLLMRFIDR